MIWEITFYSTSALAALHPEWWPQQIPATTNNFVKISFYLFRRSVANLWHITVYYYMATINNYQDGGSCYAKYLYLKVDYGFVTQIPIKCAFHFPSNILWRIQFVWLENEAHPQSKVIIEMLKLYVLLKMVYLPILNRPHVRRLDDVWNKYRLIFFVR